MSPATLVASVLDSISRVTAGTAVVVVGVAVIVVTGAAAIVLLFIRLVAADREQGSHLEMLLHGGLERQSDVVVVALTAPVLMDLLIRWG